MGGIQNGERGGNLVSEKLICYSIFQAEEKAGQLPSSKALRKEGLQEVIEELSPSQVFFRWKEWLSKCNHLFFEGLSMLTIIYIKASLKQTSRKKLCSCSVCVDCQKTSLWFDALQPATPIAMQSFMQFWRLSVSAYWLNFCFHWK